MGINTFPHFHDCTKYYRCIHGFFLEIDCEAGEVFDHVTLECKNADEARCVLEGPVAN